MAKTPSDKLHRLVRSLSPAEKRYFRLFIRGKTERDSKYLLLFETLNAAEEYDSQRVQTKIYGSQVAEAKKYPELKAYLYDLILKCLSSYDEQHSIEFRLNHYLQSVAVLFRRGHYDDCREILQKAAKLARKYERFAQHLEIIVWEKHLAYTRMDVDFLHTQLEALEHEEQQILQQLQNVTDYRKAFFGVYATIKREALHRGEDRLAKLQALVQQDVFSDPDQARSHRARVLHYRTLNLYYYAAQDTEAFYETGKILIQIIENQAFFIKESLSEYIAALSNFILACGLLHHYDEVRESLEKLRNLTPNTEDDRRKIHRQYYTGKFALCQFTGEFAEARAELAKCQEEAERLHSNDYETASFYFQYCYICFGCGDYASALDYLNEWLAQPRTVARQDLQSLARILSLILHFELGNRLLLESLARSTRRFLQQKNRLHELERRFIVLMQELLRAPSAAEGKAALEKMRAEWPALPGAKGLNQTFDLESWLDSKISGRDFDAVVKEKHLKN